MCVITSRLGDTLKLWGALGAETPSVASLLRICLV